MILDMLYTGHHLTVLERSQDFKQNTKINRNNAKKTNYTNNIALGRFS